MKFLGLEISRATPPPAEDKPMTAELASAKADFEAFKGYMRVQDKQDFIQAETREGQRYAMQLWERMELDAHLANCLSVRKSAVLSHSWQVLPWDKTPLADEIAAFVSGALAELDFPQDMRDLLDAVAKGYAVSEIIWGTKAGKWVPDDIRSKRPSRFVFGIESELRRRDIVAVNGQTMDPYEGVEMPPNKFIVARHDPRYESPYGSAILAKVFWPWWFKKNGALFWAKFLEKFAQPTVVGHHPPGALPEQKDVLLQAALAVATQTAVTIPDTMKLELLEAEKAGATASYDAYMRYWDRQISKGIIGSTLTVDEGQFGTRAQADTHESVSDDIALMDASMVEQAIGHQLIRPLVIFNFGPQPGYPYLSLSADSGPASYETSQRDQVLQEMGLPLSKQDHYDRYQVRPPENDEDLLVAPAKPGGFSPASFAEMNMPITNPDRMADEAIRGLSPVMLKAVTQAATAMCQGDDYDTAQAKLYDAFPDMNFSDLEESLQRALFISDLRGRADVAGAGG